MTICLTATAIAQPDTTVPQLCASCVRKNLEYLAGPTLNGRGSGTLDEYHAAQFIARRLKSYGLAPAGENGSYLQTGTVQSRHVTSPPVVSFDSGDASKPQAITLTHGKELGVFRLSQPEVSAPLQKLDLSDAGVSPQSVKEGAAVLLKLKPDTGKQGIEGILGAYMRTKAALLMVPASPDSEAMFQRLTKAAPRDQKKLGEEPASPDGMLVKADAAQQLWAQPEGTIVKLHAGMTPWKTTHTWNVLARIEGSSEKQQIILLSAHLDHLGIKGGKVYPGADDDGSGTVAVMELARALAKEPKPKRTVMFALWGSEEAGLIGSRYFLKHPTFELQDIVANLEFEMIGRSDPKVKPDQLWLSGWERTDFGPALAEHGALLVGDPHPEQGFFMRSDNFALAKEGIVAQTASSYGLHKDYHQPTDTADRIDWQHLDHAIASMIAPITWLANSDFTPKWNEGMKPE